MTERLTVGVAARLSRYLQVLTQARKMGKERISSQEISEYTNINATQIRRDLSAFGRVRQARRRLPHRRAARARSGKILRTQGQHNIALVGAGRLGSAIASSPIFAEHGITIAAVFDNDPEKIGSRVGRPHDQLDRRHRARSRASRTSSSASSPCRPTRRRTPPTTSSTPGAKIIFNYSEALLDVPRGRQRAHVEPRGRPPLRAVLPSGLDGGARRVTQASLGMKILIWHGYLLGGTGLERLHAPARARVVRAAGTTSPSSARSRTRSATTSAALRSCGPTSAACCPPSCSTTTRAIASSCSRTARARSSMSGSRRTRRRCATQLPADLVLVQPRACWAAPSARASGAPYAVKAHGSELEYSMRGRPELEAWGARGARSRATAIVRRLGATSARSSRRSVGHVDRVHEVPPGVDIEEWRPQRARAARSPRCSPRRGAIHRIPATRTSDFPTRATPSASRAFLAGDEPTVVYFGKLLAQQGRPRAARGAARRGCARRRRRVRRLPGRARAAGAPDRVLFTGPLEHRHLVHLLALADACVVPSIFPEAFGMVAAEAAAARLPAARRAPLRPRRGRGGPGGRSIRRALRRLDVVRDRRRRPTCAEVGGSSWRCRRPTGSRSELRRAAPRSSAGAGEASPSASWSSGVFRIAEG